MHGGGVPTENKSCRLSSNSEANVPQFQEILKDMLTEGCIAYTSWGHKKCNQQNNKKHKTLDIGTDKYCISKNWLRID